MVRLPTGNFHLDLAAVFCEKEEKQEQFGTSCQGPELSCLLQCHCTRDSQPVRPASFWRSQHCPQRWRLGMVLKPIRADFQAPFMEKKPLCLVPICILSRRPLPIPWYCSMQAAFFTPSCQRALFSQDTTKVIFSNSVLVSVLDHWKNRKSGKKMESLSSV